MAGKPCRKQSVLSRWMHFLVFILVAGSLGSLAQTYQVQTIAGGTRTGYSVDGGSAISAAYGTLGGLAADANGNVYVADRTNHRIRRISGGTVSTVAGTGSAQSPVNTDLPPLSTILPYPNDVELAPDGRLRIADSRFLRWSTSPSLLIREAGVATYPPSGNAANDDGTPSLSAWIEPHFLTVHGADFLVFSESIFEGTRRRVRVVRNGTLGTIAGGGSTPINGRVSGFSASFVDPRGVAALGNFIYTCDYGASILAITDLNWDDSPTDIAVALRHPQDVAAGADGRIYVLWEPSEGSQRLSSFTVLPGGKLTERRDLVGGGSDAFTNGIAGRTVSIAGGTHLTVSPDGLLFYTEVLVPTSNGPVSRVRMATPTTLPPEAEPCEFRTGTLLPAATVGLPYQADIRYSGSTPPNPELEAVVRNLLGDTSLQIEILHGLRVFRITGTPTIIGDKVFQLTLPCGAVKVFRLPIRPPNATIEVLPSELPPATQGCPYSATFSASGGSAPYLMTIGSSPISSTTRTVISPATISGTPPLAGTFPVSVQATDTLSRVGNRTYQFTVHPKATIASTELPPGQVGTPYRALISAQGGAAPLRWRAPVALPVGLILGTDGSISGTPTSPFSGAIIVEVTDANNCGTQAPLPLVIDDLPETVPETLSISLSNEVTSVGENYLASVILNPAPSKSHDGTIRIEFLPAAGTGIDRNPEVVFLTDPATISQSFEVTPMATKAWFPRFNDGSESLQFRTGTVAGTVRLIATLDQPPLTAIREFVVAAQPPVLDILTVTRAGNQLAVHAEGFASERRVNGGGVQLTSGAGTSIEGGGSKPLPQEFVTEFSTHFADPLSKEVGSQFVLDFDVNLTNGEASQISKLCLWLDGGPGMAGEQECAIPQ